MNPKLELLAYGLAAFVVYAILVYVLHLASYNKPVNAVFLGVYTSKDLFTGLGIAVLITYLHSRKKRIK
jgi:hypothetical protein